VRVVRYHIQILQYVKSMLYLMATVTLKEIGDETCCACFL
jgi:hypothetical protein